MDRRVEITGPTDRKMLVNALNSGAKVFMTDFEDANSPTWTNCIEAQINLKDRWDNKVDFTPTPPPARPTSSGQTRPCSSCARAAGT